MPNLSIDDLLKTVKPNEHYPELSSWHLLNRTIRDYSEEDCLKLLKFAIKAQKNERVINRIYCRYSRLRMTREQRELNLPSSRKYED